MNPVTITDKAKIVLNIIAQGNKKFEAVVATSWIPSYVINGVLISLKRYELVEESDPNQFLTITVKATSFINKKKW